MLGDIVEVAIDAVDGWFGSILNSGGSPSLGPSTVGTPSSPTSMPSSPPSQKTDPSRRHPDSRSDPDTETPHHDDPNYERDLQEQNAFMTGINLGSEVLQHVLGFNNVGKVAGPLVTIVTATPTVTEGVPLVAEYHDGKWETISGQSGDAFGDGSGRDSGGQSGTDSSNEGPSRPPPVEHTPESQEVLDNIEMKNQMDREAARRRHERYSGGWR